MKWSFAKNDLVSALGRVEKVIPVRSPTPILRNALFCAAEDGTVELSGTDLEIGVRVTLQALSVDKPCSIAMDAQILFRHLMDSPSEQVEISTVEEDDAENYVISDGESKIVLLSVPAEDFPEIFEGFEEKTSFNIKSSELQMLITQSQFSAAREEKRYAINGVYLSLSGNKIEMVATDGHRLAVSRGELDKKIEEQGAIIPLKMINEMYSLAGSMDGNDELEILLGERSLKVTGNNTEMVSRLVEGNFPRYEDVIPEKCEHKSEIDRKEFGRLLKRASIMTSEETRAVNLEFDGKMLTITSKALDRGTGEYTCEAEYDGKKSIKLAFTPVSLLDVIRVIGEEKIIIQMNQADRPVKIEEGENFTYVIMPIRPH